MIFTERTLPSVFKPAIDDFQKRTLGSSLYNSPTGFYNARERNFAKYVVFDYPFTVGGRYTYNIKNVVYYQSKPAISSRIVDGTRKYTADLSKRVLCDVPILFTHIQLDDYVLFDTKVYDTNRIRLDGSDYEGIELFPFTGEDGRQYYRMMARQEPSFTYEGKSYYSLAATDVRLGMGQNVYTLRKVGGGILYYNNPELRALQKLPLYLDLPVDWRRDYDRALRENLEEGYNVKEFGIKAFLLEFSQYIEWKNTLNSRFRDVSAFTSTSGTTQSFYGISNVWESDYNPYDNVIKGIWTKAFEVINDNEVEFGSDPELPQQIAVT